jgi:hypothetical protein
MALASGFQAALFHGVTLQKRGEVLRVTPAAFKIVVLELACLQLTNNRIKLSRQLYAQTRNLAGKQAMGSRYGRG